MGLTQVNSEGIKDDSIVNADIKSDAAIAKSKLAGLDIVNADVNASAAIAGSKLAAATTSVPGSMSAADKTKLDGIATSATAVGGATGVDFNDSVKARFGTDNDLEVYHNNSSGYISNSTGNLALESDNSVWIGSKTNTETYIKGTKDGSVELYNDNVKCLETGSNTVKVNNRLQIHADAPGTGHGLSIGQWDGSNHRFEGDANKPIFITSYNSGGVKLGVSGVNEVTVTGDGLTFNGDTAAANALDDYEESTYTPVVSGTDGWTATSSTAEASYVKIGTVCVVSIVYSSSSMSGVGGTAVLRVNLPFTSKASGSNVGQMCISEWSIGTSNVSWIGAKVNNNEAFARFQYHNGNNNNTNDLTKDAADGSLNFRGTITYITA